MKKLYMNYRLFDSVINASTSNATGNDLSPTIREYYSMHLIDNAIPELVHDQFGQKEPIPKGNGKTGNFRKFSPLPKALTPLVEGVTPDGNKLNMERVPFEVHQYGDYVLVTDILDLVAVDNILLGVNELLASQAGRTLDTVVREVLNAGTNVIYSNGKASRATLVGGQATGNDYLSVDDIRKAVRQLKLMNAKKINGNWVGIIHPDCAYDIKNDPKWEAVKDYDPHDWYEGEIGRIEGVRFVETTEAKIFSKDAEDAVEGQTRDVYSTLILGANAYGSTSLEGGGLEYIFKPLGSAGSADPLNQRQTSGWKATKGAVILSNEFMVRIESASTFEAGAN
jgi:N4-gp56 family major capsid protein